MSYPVFLICLGERSGTTLVPRLVLILVGIMSSCEHTLDILTVVCWGENYARHRVLDYRGFNSGSVINFGDFKICLKLKNCLV